MIRIAQLFSALFVLIFSAAAVGPIFFPAELGEISGFNPINDYGLTNIRTLGAPLLMMAVMTAIAVYTKRWVFLLPATIYFVSNGLTRVLSLFNEQYDSVMIRGLVITFALFGLALWSIAQFYKENQLSRQHDV